MEEFDEEDDFRDLYADVEVQVSTAISAIQALSQLPVEDDDIHGNGDGNGDLQDVEDRVIAEEREEKQDEEEGDEGPDESESEDDFDILLNDDGDDGNGNARDVIDGFLSGGSGGRVANVDDDDNADGNEVENEGNFGGENGGSSGGERHGGKGSCSGGGYNMQYKYMRYNTTSSNKLKSTGSTRLASYLSTFVRIDREGDGCTYPFGKSWKGSQSEHNFPLPRSRTILDVNIDALEQKPWRDSDADITDYFNFGFDEDSWKSYCNHLDSHRGPATKVTGVATYKHARHSKVLGPEFDHEVAEETATKNALNCNQRRAMSLTNEISCRKLQSEMLKGRAIQVEDGRGERQPSIDMRLPVDRDSDFIEIPIQDWEEDHSNSDKEPFVETANTLHEASGSREVLADGAGDILYASASKDELPMLEEPSEGTGKSNPHRCFRHTSISDDDPSCLDSDSHGSLYVSDASEEEHQVTKCNSNGLAEEIKESDGPGESDGKSKPNTITERTLESSKTEQSKHSHGSSPSQSDYVICSNGGCAEMGIFHDHSKRASRNSASELGESITFDSRSSRDYRKSGPSIRSSNYKYGARCRNLVRRNMKFQKSRSSRMSGLKNHLDDACALHMSDAEDNDANYPAVHFHKQRKRRHDSCGDKDYLYHEELEHSLNYRGAWFPGKSGFSFSGYPHGKEMRAHGCEGDRYAGRNLKGKRQLTEQRSPRLSSEVMEQKWDHYRKGIYVQEMDSSDYDVLRRLPTEQGPYLDSGYHTQSKRKQDEFHYNRRMESDEFSAKHNYGNEFTLEKFRPMSCNGREGDYCEKSHDRELPFARRETKNLLTNTRKYGHPIHDSEGIWHSDSQDERSRYARNQLSFHSYREPQTARIGQGRAASHSRNSMLGRHGWQRRQNCLERYRGSNKLDDYTAGYVNDDESIRGTYDHDSFVVGRRQYWQSKVLHLLEQENDRHQEDNIKSFGRTSNYRRFVSEPGSGHVRKCTDGREPNKKRYKLPIEGDRCSPLDQNSNSVHRDNLRQAPPSCWDSADSQIFLGDGKSSRCFKAGSLMDSGRYDFFDWSNDLEQRTADGFDKSHFEKVIQADNRKIDDFHNDANWRKKLSDSLQSDSRDTEEVQIITEDLGKKSRQKRRISGDTTQFISVKNFSTENAMDKNINAEELENPRIMEILAKMEKRRQRFQQPISLKNVPEKHYKPVADSNAETKVQRPARKRKWDGS